MSSEGTQLVAKAKRFLALQRTGEVLDKNPGKADFEIWNAAYAKELKKAELLNRDQVCRQIAKKTQNPGAVPDQEMTFKAADLVFRLVKEVEDMKKFGEAEALDRIREMKARAEAKIDEEAICRIHEMLSEEGDKIEKAKAHGMKPGLRKRPCARMMCVKRRSPSKEEKVSSSHQRNMKKWSQQFLITAQGERAAKKLKVMLVSYSGSESDEEPDPEGSGDEDNVKYEKMKSGGVRICAPQRWEK
jgi:hypothetical protein